MRARANIEKFRMFGLRGSGFKPLAYRAMSSERWHQFQIISAALIVSDSTQEGRQSSRHY